MIRTTDMEYVKSVFRQVYDDISDDFSPKVEDWQPPVHAKVIYLRPEEGGACFMFVPRNGVLLEAHVVVLSDHRDKSSAYAKACREWLRENTTYKCVVSFVSVENAAVKRLNDAIGMKAVGVVEKSWQKGGRLISQTVWAMEI